MTVIDLIDAISNRLNELFKERKINILRYSLPHSKAAENNTLTPYVIIKAEEITDNEQGTPNQALAKIKLVICTYDENSDSQGYVDTLNIMEAIRQDFLTERLLANKFMLSTPLKATIEEKDEWPYFIGHISAVWAIPRPQQPIADFVNRPPRFPR